MNLDRSRYSCSLQVCAPSQQPNRVEYVCRPHRAAPYGTILAPWNGRAVWRWWVDLIVVHLFTVANIHCCAELSITEGCCDATLDFSPHVNNVMPRRDLRQLHRDPQHRNVLGRFVLQGLRSEGKGVKSRNKWSNNRGEWSNNGGKGSRNRSHLGKRGLHHRCLPTHLLAEVLLNALWPVWWHETHVEMFLWVAIPPTASIAAWVVNSLSIERAPRTVRLDFHGSSTVVDDLHPKRDTWHHCDHMSNLSEAPLESKLWCGGAFTYRLQATTDPRSCCFHSRETLRS